MKALQTKKQKTPWTPKSTAKRKARFSASLYTSVNHHNCRGLHQSSRWNSPHICTQSQNVGTQKPWLNVSGQHHFAVLFLANIIFQFCYSLINCLHKFWFGENHLWQKLRIPIPGPLICPPCLAPKSVIFFSLVSVRRWSLPQASRKRRLKLHISTPNGTYQCTPTAMKTTSTG